jgi:hypothetical protein
MTKKISNRDWENLSAYLDGQLTPRKRARFAARLESEPALREAYDSLRRTRAMLRGLPRLRAPRNFTVTPEMVSIRQSRRRHRLIPTFQFASAIASLLLLMVLAGDFLGLGNLAAGTQRFPASPTEIVMIQEAPAAEEEITEIQVTQEVEIQKEVVVTPLVESAVEEPAEAVEEQVEELAAPMIESPRALTSTITDEGLAVKPLPEPADAITRTEPSEEDAGAVLGTEEVPSAVFEGTSVTPPPATPQAEVPQVTVTYLPYVRIAEISLALIAVLTGFAAYFLRRRG